MEATYYGYALLAIRERTEKKQINTGKNIDIKNKLNN